MRALVVEDSLVIRHGLVAVLKRSNFENLEVFEACNGLEGLSIYESNCPIDLILSDVDMPGMNGVQMMRKLRENGCNIPIILITAERSISRFMEAGATAVILKPIPLEEIGKAIRQALGLP